MLALFVPLARALVAVLMDDLVIYGPLEQRLLRVDSLPWRGERRRKVCTHTHTHTHLHRHAVQAFEFKS